MDGEDNITKGEPLRVLVSSEVDHVVEGEVRIGGQEHFYLETNANLVTILLPYSLKNQELIPDN